MIEPFLSLLPLEAGQTLILGVGNPFRGDDGVGIEAARRIAEQNFKNVRVWTGSGDAAALIDLLHNASRVIIIDAACSGGPPGQVVRFDATRERLPSGFFSCSTHHFSVAEAIETARALGQLPDELIVYGIEGRCFDHGTTISPEVRDAACRVVELILNDIQRLHPAEDG